MLARMSQKRIDGENVSRETFSPPVVVKSYILDIEDLWRAPFEDETKGYRKTGAPNNRVNSSRVCGQDARVFAAKVLANRRRCRRRLPCPATFRRGPRWSTRQSLPRALPIIRLGSTRERAGRTRSATLSPSAVSCITQSLICEHFADSFNERSSQTRRLVTFRSTGNSPAPQCSLVSQAGLLRKALQVSG
jgi:hypothetical protein